MILFPAIKQVRTNPQFLAHFRRAQAIKDHQPHRFFLELSAVTLPSHSSILQLRESHVHFSQATSVKLLRRNAALTPAHHRILLNVPYFLPLKLQPMSKLKSLWKQIKETSTHASEQVQTGAGKLKAHVEENHETWRESARRLADQGGTFAREA